MEQSYNPPNSESGSEETRDALGTAAAEFSKNIQQATGNLVAAAEQFSAMSVGLNSAVEEVKAASLKAQEAQKAAEAVQAKIERDYGNLSTLMKDLQERIGALAVLARPLSIDNEPASSEPQASEAATDEASSENQAEESAPESSENAPSPAGSWQGWKGQ